MDAEPQHDPARLFPRSPAWVRTYPLKRPLDIAIACAALVLCVPLLALIAAVVLLASGRPVLYRSRRLGQGGRVFTMLKFRTMVPDAEEQLPALAGRNVATGMVKIPHDPRVTRVGRWLRRFSVDELPQLWNVLRGDMSMVGPRPHGALEIEPDLPPHRLRLAFRPGMTGLWQLRSRHDPSLQRRVYWDWQYISTCSLRLDMKLMVETLPEMLRGRGGTVLGSGTAGDRHPKTEGGGAGQDAPAEDGARR
jgi:lipopolysaccharide/colanic/teichoic acid biosynthesis glycosyltransferase